MFRLPRLAAFAVWTLLAIRPLAAAPPTLASASPSPDSVAEGSPDVLELTFAQGVEAAQSRISVKGPNGRRVDVGRAYSVADDKHLAIGLKTLLPGHYVVDWHVLTPSADRASGSYGFTVGQ